MKRDINLIRAILRDIEGLNPTELPSAVSFRDEGYDDAAVFEHVRLMIGAGLLEGEVMDGYPTPEFVPKMRIRGLTWAGYDFLANASEESRWEKAKEVVAKKAGSVAFDLFSEVLAKMARASLGQP